MKDHSPRLPREWKETSRTELLRTPIFTVSRARRRSAAGKEGEFLLVDAPDWVAILPVIRVEPGSRRFLMVRQYRHGCRCVTFEFPGGLVDPGEDPATAAARELREETGYRAGRIVPIGSSNPNPSFMTNTCHFFAAFDLVSDGPQQLDPLEEVEVVEVREAELDGETEAAELMEHHAIMRALLQAFRSYERQDRD